MNSEKLFRKSLLIILALAMVSSVTAQTNTTQDNTSILDEEWSFEYCDGLDESLENGECSRQAFVVHPVRIGLYLVIGFFAVGVALKWYRTWVKGEPF